VTAGRYRLGVDIGGTFTDVMVADDAGSVIATLKTPSVPGAPEEAIFTALDELRRSGVAPEDVALFVHGTTLAVNTLIERTGATTGLLVTRGFRDVLEIRRLRLDNTTDFYGDKPLPLVPRDLVVEIDERLLADGRVHRPLELDQVREAVRRLAAAGATAVAVCFMHAYANPAHERQVRDLVRAEFPSLFVCAGADLWPQQREYERCLVAVMNAYIGARMAGYFHRLEAGAVARGLRAQALSTKSNGGVMTASRAAEEPVQTLLSGPASGVIGAAHVARLAGATKIVTVDMGGTSADVAIVVDGHAAYSTENQVGDFPVIMPAVDVSSIGAGGGSIAWLDAAGVLKVGPRSAGADPGPACYGRGGAQPTVTDAYVHLGIIAPDRFLGGRMPLEPERAAAALAALGRSIGRGSREAAQAILDVATANMYAQFTPLMARKGVDPRDFTLLAYGGAGPTHAFLLAREVGIGRVLIPPSPGTLCALGCVVADLRNDFVHTLYRADYETTDAALEEAYAELERQGRRWLEEESAQGIPLASSFVLYSADMRYEGQAFEIEIAVPGDERGRRDTIARRFHEAYHTIFGVSDRQAPVTFVNLRATVVGVTAKVSRLRARAGAAASGPRETRPVFVDGRMQDVAVLPRAALPPDGWTPGPLVVEQYDTTTFVPPGFRVRADDVGNLVGEAAR
jgi:N-methylhydantoinase A